MFFSTKQSSPLERLLEDIIWKSFNQYLDSNQTPTKRIHDCNSFQIRHDGEVASLEDKKSNVCL
jgi:hypothetical protein